MKWRVGRNHDGSISILIPADGRTILRVEINVDLIILTSLEASNLAHALSEIAEGRAVGDAEVTADGVSWLGTASDVVGSKVYPQ